MAGAAGCLLAAGAPIPQNGRVSTVLIALPGGEGVVRRDDRDVWVTQDVSADHGQSLRADDVYHPVKTWLSDDRSVVGGLLPPGAVSVEVVDDRGERVAAGVGGGAYAAVLEQPNDGREPVVCCRDAGGAPVRRPLPADYPSGLVDDADVPCPACGAIDYEERVPTESWRGGRTGPNGTVIPDPIVVCRRCGQEEREGTFFGVDASSEDDQDEAARETRIARARAHARVARWYSNTMTLRALTFPVYAAEGWPAVIGGSGSRRDQLTSLTIDHYDAPDADPYAGDRPRFEITTSRPDSPVSDELQQARWTLHTWLQNDDDARSSWPEASHAAVTLWLAARDRKARAKALAAARSELLISVDGTREPFLTLTAATGHRVAIRRHEDVMITIAARELDPTAIIVEPLAEPSRPPPRPRAARGQGLAVWVLTPARRPRRLDVHGYGAAFGIADADSSGAAAQSFRLRSKGKPTSMIATTAWPGSRGRSRSRLGVRASSAAGVSEMPSNTPASRIESGRAPVWPLAGLPTVSCRRTQHNPGS
jgi:hypothetical protein